jgi:hypothetical protein
MDVRAALRKLSPVLISGALLAVVVFVLRPMQRQGPTHWKGFPYMDGGVLVDPPPGAETAETPPDLPADPPPSADEVSPFELDGTHIRVRKPDGAYASDAELVGAVLVAREEGAAGSGATVKRLFRIDGVDVDRADPSGEIVLYTLSVKDPAKGTWGNACTADLQGVAKGFPIAGVWTATGAHVRAPGRFEMTCTGGAYGKCVRWGYKPWKSAEMWDRHQACTRMVRADYCGDGVGHTRNGVPIDVFDTVGVQADEFAPGMDFEAGWGTDGAVCVRHTRVPELFTLDRIRAACPGKLDALLGAACTEERAKADAHALLFDRS